MSPFDLDFFVPGEFASNAVLRNRFPENADLLFSLCTVIASRAFMHREMSSKTRDVVFGKDVIGI